MTAARHTSQDFVALLERLAAVPLGLGRFMSGSTICRRTRPRASSYFLRPTPRCGFTSSRPIRPGSIRSSCGSPRLSGDVIARGVFTSRADLGKRLRKYIRAYSKSAPSLRRTYNDPYDGSLLTKSPGQLTSHGLHGHGSLTLSTLFEAPLNLGIVQTARKALPPDQIHGHRCPQVGKEMEPALPGKEIAPLDSEAFAAHQLIEVINRQKVNVGRVVPFVREEISFGRAAGEQ